MGMITMKRQQRSINKSSTKRQKSLETEHCKCSCSVPGATQCNNDTSNIKRAEVGTNSCGTDSVSRCGFATPKLPPGFGWTKDTRKYYNKTSRYGNGCKSSYNTNRALNFTTFPVPKNICKNKSTSSDIKTNLLPTIIKPDNDGNICSKQELHEETKNTDISKYNTDVSAYDDIDGMMVKDSIMQHIDNSTTHYNRSKSDQSDIKMFPSVMAQSKGFLLNTYPPPGRTHDLETDDLEQDIIIATDVLDTHIKCAPTCIPAHFKNMKPRAPPFSDGLVLLQYIGLSGKKKPDQESMIYIPHQFADKPIGDEFGASIRTYSIHQKDGTIYHQHFFVDVQSSGPAGKMRIANNDEIVLLNGEFVPEVTHTDLLNLFHKVKVDGRTRFKLIIRRVHTRVLKKNWEWIDTSAILAPDHHHIFDDYPVVEDKIFKKLEGNEYEIKSIQYYKVPGTQYYLDIRLDTVLADVWTATDSDKTKRICKMSRWKQDETGMICFTATLCNEAETCYIAIGQGNHIALSHSPVWFEMAAMAKNIMFKLNNMYLACNKQTGQIVASQSEFLFEELPEDGGVDRPDGAMAFLCRTKDGMPLDSDMTPRDTMMSSTTASMTSSTTSSSIVEVHNDSGYEFSNSGHSSTASSQSSSATVASASGSSGYDTYMPEEMETSPVNDVTALNIPENGFTFTTSSDLLRTPTTPLASLFIANY